MNILFDALIMTNYFLVFKDFKKQKTKAVGQEAKAYKKHKSTCRIPDLKEQTDNCKDGSKQSGSRQVGGSDKKSVE